MSELTMRNQPTKRTSPVMFAPVSLTIETRLMAWVFLPPPYADIRIPRINLNQARLPVQIFASDHGRPSPGERSKHDISEARAVLNRPLDEQKRAS